MKIYLNKAINLSKLQDELLLQGLIEPGYYFGEDYFIAPDDADMSAIQAVIDAHDPTPPPPPLQSINITTDKTEIVADGIDTATITITLEPGGAGINTVDVLVDGPPVTEVDVIDDVATFEFTATDPGKYMIEVISGDVRDHIFVKAV